MSKYIITKAYNQGDWFNKDFALISGDLMDSRTYVHFRTFAIALEECETFNSFDELLKSKLK